MISTEQHFKDVDDIIHYYASNRIVNDDKALPDLISVKKSLKKFSAANNLTSLVTLDSGMQAVLIEFKLPSSQSMRFIVRKGKLNRRNYSEKNLYQGLLNVISSFKGTKKDTLFLLSAQHLQRDSLVQTDVDGLQQSDVDFLKRLRIFV